jgi:hypothetical protein
VNPNKLLKSLHPSVHAQVLYSVHNRAKSEGFRGKYHIAARGNEGSDGLSALHCREKE